MTEVLSLHSGTVFKHAFSKPNIFREFVRDITGVEINPKQIHTEYEYNEPVGNVKIKYDIFAEDDKERVVVEIQHIKEEDFFARFLYYHMIGIIEQVAKHDAYEPPKRVFTIVVLASVPRDGSITFSWGRHLMEILDEHNKRHEIAPHELIFLNPRLVNESTPDSTKPWLELIKDSFDKQMDKGDYESPTFKDLIDSINKQRMTDAVSAGIKDETAWEMASQRFHEEGVEEGVEIGMEEGIEKGRRQQQEETARIMLEKDVELSIITAATGLTVEEIEALHHN